MMVGNFRTGLTPGSELEQCFGSESAEFSIFNLAGYGSEAVDSLIDAVEAADDRQTLDDATRALDRVLRVEIFWVPQCAHHRLLRYVPVPGKAAALCTGNAEFLVVRPGCI